MNVDAAAPRARVRNSPPLSLAWFLSLLPLGPRSVFAVPPCHIGSIRSIARGAAMAPDPRRLVDRQVVWLGFSARDRVWQLYKVARHARPCAGHPRLVFR